VQSLSCKRKEVSWVSAQADRRGAVSRGSAWADRRDAVSWGSAWADRRGAVSFPDLSSSTRIVCSTILKVIRAGVGLGLGPRLGGVVVMCCSIIVN